MKTQILRLVFVSIIFCSFSALHAQDNCMKARGLAKSTAGVSAVQLNINNIASVFQNDAVTDANINPSGGFEYPRGSGKIAVCSSGLLWGAKVGSEIRVGGTEYRSGLQPGRIISVGKAEDQANTDLRVFRVRPDYLTSNFENEVAQGEGSVAGIKGKYEKDWNEWPAKYGAPFNDKNGNGIYEPSIDIPGYPDAAQTIWFVANDLDVEKVKSLYGSTPLGVELQCTAWAYNSPIELKNTVFRKYRLINKSGINLTDVYFCLFTDIDIGTDVNGRILQLCGSDSTLNLVYGYSGTDTDKFYGRKSPAIGVVVLQGPLVNGNSNDFGAFNGTLVGEKKNLTASSIFHFYCGGSTYNCPSMGSYSGTLSYYNYFQGIENATGKAFTIPFRLGGTKTKYTLSGDPMTGSGWVDGIDHAGGERYENIASGPFDFASGETQEIVFAQIVGEGSSRLDAINVLKDYTTKVNTRYKLGLYKNGTMLVDVKEKAIPNSFSLEQNYPNPFNPETNISYQIAQAGNVSLKIYDILGREVVTLVNEFKLPGRYNCELSRRDAFSKNGELSSGIYFYQMKTNGFVQTKKMVLTK
jgi:hypothetical protein